MRRLIMLVFIVITAAIFVTTISTHKAREPNYRPVNMYFSSEGKYFTFDYYH